MFVLSYLAGAAGHQQPTNQPGAAAAARVPATQDTAAVAVAASVGPDTRFISSSTSVFSSPHPRLSPENEK
jgi:hypothetical protein